VLCLINTEQMGEGWSDFLALALTTPTGASATDKRGVGTYSVFQPTDGDGSNFYSLWWGDIIGP